MTDKQIVTELGKALAAPAQAGAPNKALTRLSVGTAWSVRDRITTGTLWVDGQPYIVRVGTEGAEGFLTFTPNQILLGLKPVKLTIGEKGVAGVFVGTTQVYSNTALAWVLYDAGIVPGIEWDINRLPRPQYTSYGSAALNADHMVVYVSSSATATHNAHVITRKVTPVPASASRLNVEVQSSGDGKMVFGLLPANAPTSYKTDNGGLLSAALTAGGTVVTKSLTLTSAVKGKDDLYAVINWQGDASSRVLINKVWFD